uniref:AlNc14C217G9027 protein n=1 Tax=Albugo laibachii Nc14 TaxID=890382 RepID=F0WRM9_9STRA|nr:AlNc14C217G9027 [Albugo laibachii Nc14]|eukprot:CCA23993.1 AlNc14C217G9027 [Albugo laibachii Nc14]
MDQAAEDHVKAPAATHANDDGTSMASSEGEGMAGLLDLVAELNSDIGALLTRLEARRTEDDQASFVSDGSSTFRAYTEARARHGRQMTLSSLEDKVMPASVRQHAAGNVNQRMERSGDRQGTPIHPPWDTGYRQVPAQTYFSVQRLLQIRGLKVVIDNFDGKEV